MTSSTVTFGRRGTLPRTRAVKHIPTSAPHSLSASDYEAVVGRAGAPEVRDDRDVAEVSALEVDLYIGPNSEAFAAARTAQLSGSGFEPTWSWAAFFFPFYWLLYRRLYLYAFLFTVLSAVIAFNAPLTVLICGYLTLHFGVGLSAKHLYAATAIKRVSRLKARVSDPTLLRARIATAGGTSMMAIVLVGIILPAMVIVPALLTASAFLAVLASSIT